MKLVTMQIHRFRETGLVAVDHHVLVLVNRDVSIAVHRHISLAIGRQRTSCPGRFIEPLPASQAGVLIDRHVPLIVRADAIHPNITAIKGRVRIHLLMKAGARDVSVRWHTRRRVCLRRSCRMHLRCAPCLRFRIGIRAALNLLALRRQGQSEASNAYRI